MSLENDLSILWLEFCNDCEQRDYNKAMEECQYRRQCKESIIEYYNHAGKIVRFKVEVIE